MTRLLSCLLVTFAFACADPIVGAHCREGFGVEFGMCFPAGVDAGLPDGAAPDVALPDAHGGDGSVPPDGSTTDSGTPGCDLGRLRCGGVCVRPDIDPSHCGGCGYACAAGDVCVGGRCAAGCDSPLTMCGGVCIDRDSDSDHCGGCWRRCPSGLCTSGVCALGTVGRIVLIGHDYRTSRVGMNRVVGNAVFLARGAPVDVVVYDQHAHIQSVTGVDRAVDQVARSTGRAWQRLVAEQDQLPFSLASADALVIYPQPRATDVELQKQGGHWATALRTFLRRGGVIVSLDGPGLNRGTWQILSAAGLVSVDASVEVTGQTLDVVAPGDAVALGVPTSYLAESRSVRFNTTEATPVIECAQGPIVIHKVVRP